MDDARSREGHSRVAVSSSAGAQSREILEPDASRGQWELGRVDEITLIASYAITGPSDSFVTVAITPQDGLTIALVLEVDDRLTRLAGTRVSVLPDRELLVHVIEFAADFALDALLDDIGRPREAAMLPDLPGPAVGAEPPEGLAPGVLAPEEFPPEGPAPELQLAQVAASMPAVVQVDVPVTITVVLSHGEITFPAGQAHDEQVIAVDPELPVTITLIRDQFELVGRASPVRTMMLPAVGKRREVRFRVRAPRVGEAQVQLVVRQSAPVPLATLRLLVTVQKGRPTTRVRGTASNSVTSAPQLLAPNALIVDENRVGTNSELQFAVLIEGEQWQYFERTIDDKPGVLGDLFAAIAEGWESHADFSTRLAELGAGLAADVLPQKLRDYLAAHLDGMTDLTLVTSGETDIPWEVVYLGDPEAGVDESRFLARKGLVRWIYNTAHPISIRVSSDRARSLCPQYEDDAIAALSPGLEEDLLSRHFGATPIDDASAAVVSELLAGDRIDLLHFGGHGRTDESVDPPRQQLLLAGYVAGSPGSPSTAFSVEDLRAALPDAPGAITESGPLVVLNACRVGRPPSTGSEQGSFAEAFLRGGAAAFVGCLWSVGNTAALTFVDAFYSDLLDPATPATIASATVRAREAARADNDPSWLAYTVYAHPDAAVLL